MDNYIVGNIDFAQVALYTFWLFFFGLVAYLVREGMREGYPTVSEKDGKPIGKAFIFPAPSPKTFTRPDGSTITVPEPANEYELKAEPTGNFSGAPLTPTGDPLADGVGPAAYALRPEWPDRNAEGEPRLRPMRFDNHFSVAKEDADPRGFKVVCFDGESPGTVTDLWIDRAECLIRYIEVETASGPKLLPMTLAIVKPGSQTVQVRSVSAEQFLRAPETVTGDEVTLREEDRIQAYFTGGTLYAHSGRTEPLI
ncbi:MAG: photosynthetic reaction center subunit H [Pseudomonadota bacterium]